MVQQDGLYQHSGSASVKFVHGRIWAWRFLWALAGAMWIAILSLPALGMLLAVRGELSWQLGEHRAYRVWVVTEQKERGLGWEVRHAVSGGVEQVCLQTTVGFWLWRGQGKQNGSIYCECYWKRPGAQMEYLGECAAIEPD